MPPAEPRLLVLDNAKQCLGTRRRQLTAAEAEHREIERAHAEREERAQAVKSAGGAS